MAAEVQQPASTELERRRPDAVPMPGSGERLDLTASNGQLARYLDEAAELKRQIDVVRKMIGDELLERMDAGASWTVREDGYKISGKSPATSRVWDVERTRQVLRELVEARKITRAAALAAIKKNVSYSVQPAGINAVLKLPGMAAALEDCWHEVEPSRGVPSVSRGSGPAS